LFPEQQRDAATVWIFRELLGKHFNIPVGYILSKKALAAAIRNPDHVAASLERELNQGRSAEKRVTRGFVEKFYHEAAKMAGKKGEE
jgi:hypothetical protein